MLQVKELRDTFRLPKRLPPAANLAKRNCSGTQRCLCNQIKRSGDLQNIPETERVLLLLWSTHARLCFKERFSNRLHTCLRLFLSIAKRL